MGKVVTALLASLPFLRQCMTQTRAGVRAVLQAGQTFNRLGDTMKIEIEWQKPILLAKNKRIVYHENDFDVIEEEPGVYFFSRKYGDAFAPFYIGETLNLRGRLKTHLKSANIMFALKGMHLGNGLQKIANGARHFHYGYLNAKATSPKTCLATVQKFMIREALIQGIPLINDKLTKLPTDMLVFSGSEDGRAIFPKSSNIEKQKKM